jgi:hypothetical protein
MWQSEQGELDKQGEASQLLSNAAALLFLPALGLIHVACMLDIGV